MTRLSNLGPGLLCSTIVSKLLRLTGLSTWHDAKSAIEIAGDCAMPWPYCGYTMAVLCHSHWPI